MREKIIRINNETEINITPMLDVVFIMLIFFIVTSSFVKESGIEVYSTQKSVSHPIESTIVNIKLSPSGTHSVNGMETQLAGIESLLVQLRSKNPDIKVQIHCANEILTGELVQVIQQIKNTGINHYQVNSY